MTLDTDNTLIEAKISGFTMNPPSLTLVLPQQSNLPTIPVPASIVDRGFKLQSDKEIQLLRNQNSDLNLKLEASNIENSALRSLLYVFEEDSNQVVIEEEDIYEVFSSISKRKLSIRKPVKSVGSIISLPFEIDFED